MKSIEESVVTAMTVQTKHCFHFYLLLQDIWEIGADPDAIIKLISKYFKNITDLKVIDLGCGKGAVS
jgi:ubiquinone/menaquinone biosynthesis C-methylase UbiE